MSAAKSQFAIQVFADDESTYNTPVTPAATDAVQIIPPRPEVTQGWLYDGKRHQQNAGLGQIQQAPKKGRHASGTIRCEAKGNGAAYTSSSVVVPHIHKMLMAAGFTPTLVTTGGAESWTFAPTAVDVAPTSLTYNFYMRNELWVVAGARNNLRIVADGPGIPVWEFPFVGTMATDPTEVGLTTATYHSQTVIPPTVPTTTFTLGNFSGGKIRSFTFDLGRSIDNPRATIQGSDAHAGFTPGPREPTLEFVMEASALQATPFHATAALDPYTLQKNATAGLTFDVLVTNGQYNRWKLSFATGLQINTVECIDEVSALWKLSGTPYTSSQSAVNDVSILFD